MFDGKSSNIGKIKSYNFLILRYDLSSFGFLYFDAEILM